MCCHVFAFIEYATTRLNISDKVKLMQLAKPTIKASPLITASCSCRVLPPGVEYEILHRGCRYGVGGITFSVSAVNFSTTGKLSQK